jgi:hypothetical protein
VGETVSGLSPLRIDSRNIGKTGLIDDVGWFACEANRGLPMGQAEVEKGVKGGWIFTMLFCLSPRHALE